MFVKITILSILFLLTNAGNASAHTHIVSSSANLKRVGVDDIYEFDIRILKLQMFLEKLESPMASHAEILIANADKYDLDWRLVAAIAGVESTFGKYMPENSFNAFGWANGLYKFASWEESIGIVSKTLRFNYVAKGATNIESIAKIYAPPSKTWADKVKYFIYQIDSSPVEFYQLGCYNQP